MINANANWGCIINYKILARAWSEINTAYLALSERQLRLSEEFAHGKLISSYIKGEDGLDQTHF